MASDLHSRGSAGSGRRLQFGRGFSSLRIYNYRLFWLGQLVSLTGTWMQRLAQAWLVLQLTKSPFALGMVSTLQFLPITIFSLYGGVIADRFPKRRLLLVTQSVAAAQAVVMATLTMLGLITMWEIYVLAALLGLVTAFNAPASQSFPVELVGREEVANAVALNSTLFNATRVAGPSLAGLTIATIGVVGCFWLNAISFLAVIGGLLAMKPELFYARPKRQAGSAARLLLGGLQYAVRTPEVFVLFLALLFLGTFGFNFGVILPLLARFTLNVGSLRYGFLFSAFGAGSLLGALSLAFTRGLDQKGIFLGGAVFAVFLALVGLSHLFLLSLGLLVLLGFFSVVYSVSTQTRLQVIVPDELRGRVMSLYTLLFAGSTPIGSQFVGVFSERWSVGASLVASGAFSALGLILAALYFRYRSNRPVRAVATTSAGSEETIQRR
jgi:MFS family permease